MSSSEHLTTYAELAEVVESLPFLVREQRRRLRLSQRAAATQIGCSFSTICRLEQGETGFNARLLADLLRWLDRRDP